MALVDLDSVPMWLATIDARKAKEHIRGNWDSTDQVVPGQLENSRVG